MLPSNCPSRRASFNDAALQLAKSNCAICIAHCDRVCNLPERFEPPQELVSGTTCNIAVTHPQLTGTPKAKATAPNCRPLRLWRRGTPLRGRANWGHPAQTESLEVTPLKVVRKDDGMVRKCVEQVFDGAGFCERFRFESAGGCRDILVGTERFCFFVERWRIFLSHSSPRCVSTRTGDFRLPQFANRNALPKRNSDGASAPATDSHQAES